MNALYITYDGLTDSLGQSQVLPYIIGLSKRNINFTIISFEKPFVFHLQKSTIQKIVTQNNIKWIPLKYTKKPPFLSTIYDLYQLKKTVKKSIDKNNISLIHCRSYLPALIGFWAKKKYNIPFVFDMRGFWADERIDGNIWNLNNFIHKKAYRYFKKKEKKLLQESAYTISLTHCGKDEINSWKLNHLSPIQVIPCCTDENLFNINNQHHFRKELNIPENSFVLSYLGSIGTWYMLDEMLDFFKALLTKKTDAIFLFITKDEPSSILKKAIKKGISPNNIIVKSSDRKNIPSYINTSNASIFFIKPAYSKKASSPTKMGEIMNLGIPIVCNSGVGDVDDIIHKTMPNLLINDFHEKEYKKIIKELLDNYSCIDRQKIHQTSHEYFSLRKGVDSYYSVYQSILNTKE